MLGCSECTGLLSEFSQNESFATSTLKHATRRTLAHLSGRRIHPSAWKVNSPKFAGTAFSEVRLQKRPLGITADYPLCFSIYGRMSPQVWGMCLAIVFFFGGLLYGSLHAVL